VPRRLLLAALLAALGCGSDSDHATQRARDLERALSASDTPRDTVAQRADSQFATCLYIYDSEEKLRECLVVRNGWKAEDAERQIVIWKAKVSRLVDSIETERRREQDSSRGARLRKAAALQAEVDDRARADSIRLAAFPIWASRSQHKYFSGRAGCLLAATLPEWDRVLFNSVDEAESAGYRATAQNILACRVGSP
jgi:hypothetical protein